ncbi:MAG: sec-independent protein translocase protein TatC, partial [Frankiaceae bacterium]|nr:sec-independent protein translocase protein TatC [Frankiaceae bacterium]
MHGRPDLDAVCARRQGPYPRPARVNRAEMAPERPYRVISALLEVNQYISFVISMLIIFGVSFEFPLVLILLNLAGVVTSTRLRAWRRAAIFVTFIFAGFATPTQDPFSMLALAVPLCLL